jgi:hypothetical protein
LPERTWLVRLTTVDDRKELGARYAKANAPTHPHPHAPDTPGNKLLAQVLSSHRIWKVDFVGEMRRTRATRI